MKGTISGTLGVNFTYVLRAAFARADSKRAKRHWPLDCLFVLWGSVHVQAEH